MSTSGSAVNFSEAVDSQGRTMELTQFVADFGQGLLEAVRQQNPPLFQGVINPKRQAAIDSLVRKPFTAQANVVHAQAALLVDQNQPAGVINAEMGTGKTMMAIALANVLHHEGIKRSLVICPPHLVYKWRREIQKTVQNAKVWVLNGPDTLAKLLQLRLVTMAPEVPEFFIMGRVRMRMGFSWKPAFSRRLGWMEHSEGSYRRMMAACPKCGEFILDPDQDEETLVTPEQAISLLNDRRVHCRVKQCQERLWSLVRPGKTERTERSVLIEAISKIPTIGPKTAEKLIDRFGSEMLTGMLGDNVHEFINLMDGEGQLVFSDRQASRMERAMAKMEFGFGQGGYQPTEFIKRYLPNDFFGLLVVDEGHEYKNEGSAQGQAFGVLARKCKKLVLLTGTLMGGYADDLFYLLWRMNPALMIEDGFAYNNKGSLSTASMAFMREHGVIKDIYTEREQSGSSHRTARGQKSINHSTSKGPGF
jgi:SNF2 family DNA or RNA helicase